MEPRNPLWLPGWFRSFLVAFYPEMIRACVPIRIRILIRICVLYTMRRAEERASKGENENRKRRASFSSGHSSSIRIEQQQHEGLSCRSFVRPGWLALPRATTFASRIRNLHFNSARLRHRAATTLAAAPFHVADASLLSS